MTLIQSDSPMPNLFGKTTTILQLIYIAIIFFKKILTLDFSILILDIFIIIITILSLIVYSYNWLKDIKIYHNE